jgi:hypothetical protein
LVTTLSLDPFTRDLWGEYDAYARAQLAPMAYDPCFKPKFYVAPDLQSNNLVPQESPTQGLRGVPAGGYVEYGLTITPGALIVGSILFSTAPRSFLFQMTDVSLSHKLYDQPVPAWFLANAKCDFPNLWNTPYPVVGSGLFRMEFWNQAVNGEGAFVPAVIQLVLIAMEPCEPQ